MPKGHTFNQDRSETQQEKIAMGIVKPVARSVLDMLVYWMDVEGKNNGVITDAKAIQEANGLGRSTVFEALGFLERQGFILKVKSYMYFINPRAYKITGGEDVNKSNHWAFNARVVVNEKDTLIGEAEE